MRGKVAVVTAASGGLGPRHRRGIRRRGLQTAADEIAHKTGGTVFPYRADCAVEADIVALVHDTVRMHGRLDVMMCNSIGPKTAPFDEMTDALWREAPDVKVVAPLRIAREAFKAMQPQRWSSSPRRGPAS